MRVDDGASGPDSWQWFGSFDVAPDGRLDAIWNSTVGSVNVSELRYAFSYDGGATWSSSVAVLGPISSGAKAISTRQAS